MTYKNKNETLVPWSKLSGKVREMFPAQNSARGGIPEGWSCRGPRGICMLSKNVGTLFPKHFTVSTLPCSPVPHHIAEEHAQVIQAASRRAGISFNKL